MNDGITSGAGIVEGFAAAGVSTGTLAFAGVAAIVTGGFAAAAGRYTEERTEWEMNRGLLDALDFTLARGREDHDAPAGNEPQLVSAGLHSRLQ